MGRPDGSPGTVAGGAFQRIFDFGNGPASDNVWLGQFGNGRDMRMEVWVGNAMRGLTAPNAIIQGETATWRAGVDANGTMWIEKNGARIASGPGQLPRNVVRTNLFVGRSNWTADTPLIGQVSSLTVR